MPAIKLSSFGGMIPATDPRLLSDNMAAEAENVWLYAGTLEGIREPKAVHTCTDPFTKRVFRIPKDYVDKDHIADSYWMEFEYKDVDVLKSPTSNDSFDRYYWAMDAKGIEHPRYNTLARIASGSPSYLLGIPAPSDAPALSSIPHKYSINAGRGMIAVTGGLAEGFYTTRYAIDAGTFLGKIPPPDTANLTYKMTGSNAMFRWKTGTLSNRITVADDGSLTIGIPTRTPDPVTPDPGPTPRIVVSRSYVYTWVSAYGEEGPPSPATTFTAYEDDPWYVRVTAPKSADTTERNLSKVRIYRTITSSAGVATYFFVSEQDITTTSYTDNQLDTDISSNNQLASFNWSAPPTDLAGMVAMPNGMFVGFRENEIWFNEPYRPHAWPPDYTQSVDYKIVGLGVMGQTVVICTEAATYAATGINPSSTTVSKISHREPCLSRGSIVSTPAGVLYASPNGLMLAIPGQVQNATKSLFTKDKWLSALQVSELRGAMLGNSYYAYGSISPGCFQEDCFQSGDFEFTDYTGARTGGIIDGSDARTAFVRLTNDTPTMNICNDPWTNEVFVLRGGVVYQIDISEDRPRSEYTWTSKKFQMVHQQNLEAIKIYFDNPESVSGLGTLRIYADGRLVGTKPLTVSGAMIRMPSGFRADFWQIEIVSRVVISNIQMATSARELANV